MQYGDEIAVTDSEKENYLFGTESESNLHRTVFLWRKVSAKMIRYLCRCRTESLFVAVLFALAKIRTVPIMMLPAHREAELEGIIALAKPTAYVVAERYLGFSYVEMAMNMQKKLPCIQNVFVDGVQREEWYEPETEGQGEFRK